MTKFNDVFQASKIHRSHDMRLFAMAVVDDIDRFTNGDRNCEQSAFVLRDGTKYIVSIGCIDHEYQCEDIPHVVDALRRMADASREDEIFQTIIENAMAQGGDSPPVDDDMGPFFDYMERYQIIRSNHASFVSTTIRESIEAIDTEDGDTLIQGACFSKEGSAYVVSFFGDMEFKFATLPEVRTFLVMAADAAREDDEFQNALDAAWEAHCGNCRAEREKYAEPKPEAPATVCESTEEEPEVPFYYGTPHLKVVH